MLNLLSKNNVINANVMPSLFNEQIVYMYVFETFHHLFQNRFPLINNIINHQVYGVALNFHSKNISKRQTAHTTYRMFVKRGGRCDSNVDREGVMSNADVHISTWSLSEALPTLQY